MFIFGVYIKTPETIPNLLFKFLTSNHLHYAFYVRYHTLEIKNLVCDLRLILRREKNLHVGALESLAKKGNRKT